MDLTLSLTQQLEYRLREKAAQDGIAPEKCALQLLEGHLVERSPSELTDSELLMEANRGLSSAVWERYRQLIELRKNGGCLSKQEQNEFLELNELIETAHANRLEFIAELAQRRGVALRDLMDELGFPNYGTA